MAERQTLSAAFRGLIALAKRRRPESAEMVEGLLYVGAFVALQLLPAGAARDASLGEALSRLQAFDAWLEAARSTKPVTGGI